MKNKSQGNDLISTAREVSILCVRVLFHVTQYKLGGDAEEWRHFLLEVAEVERDLLDHAGISMCMKPSGLLWGW